MYAWIAVSEGMETPYWEQYLPRGITEIRFFGDCKAGESLTVWAARLGIAVHTAVEQVPDVVIAFWNGTPDFVDAAVAATTVQTLVYLPNERVDGYTLL